MNIRHLLLSFTLLSLSPLSHSFDESCDLANDDKTAQLINDIGDLIPVNDADSCAVKDQLSKVATWRDGIPVKIDQFISANTQASHDFPELYDQIVQNSVNVPADLAASLKTTKEEYEKIRKVYDKTKSDASAAKVNELVKKWRMLDIKIKQSTAPIQKRVRDVLVGKLSSDAFKLRLKDLATNKHCIKNANFNMSAMNGFYDDEKSEQELNKRIAGMENDKSGDGLTVCSGIEKSKSPTVAAVEKENFDIGDEDFFGNNESDLSPDKVKRIIGKITKSLKSAKPNCEKQIKSVQISTSSSQLANSPAIGKWDFMKLSKARADFLADAIQTNLKLDDKTDIITDPTGLNGDGTSGPCPYIAVKEKNGTYSAKLKDISKMQKALKDARYGSISLEIEEVGPGCTQEEKQSVRAEHEYFASKCYSVSMECTK